MSGKNRSFSLLHYLAIKSAHVCNPTYKIFLFCKNEPTGKYWEMIKDSVNVVFIEPPTEVFGNKINHVAHQSDVVRLRILKEQGGIYLDMDTITIKSFDELLTYPAVMGFEGEEKESICNAVIFSEPNNRFICEWYNKYKTFSSKNWNTHSTKLPCEMNATGQYTDSLKVMNYDVFHYPLWDKKGSIMIWEETHEFPNAYIHHVWESMNKKYVNRLTLKYINTVNNTYNRIARRYV